MTNQKTLLLALSLSLLCGLFGSMWWFSSPHHPTFNPYNPAFDQYLTAYTTGEISRKSTIKLRFVDPLVSTEQVGEILPESPFEFNPAIAGQARWLDAQTLEFIPAQPLPSGQVFKATLDMESLISDLPEALTAFSYQFATRRNDFQVSLVENRVVGKQEHAHQQVQGVLRTLDYVPVEELEKSISLDGLSEEANITWEHSDDGKTHTFSIDKLARKKEAYKVSLKVNGNTIGVENSGQTDIFIPAVGIFKHLHTYSYVDPEQHVVLEFSERIKEGQSLKGLIKMGKTPVKFLVDGNRIKVFPQKQISGSSTVQVFAGIKSEAGTPLPALSPQTVTFAEIKPSVRLLGKGVILPQSESMPFIFEAIGLNSIDLRIIRINEKNIPQFLQVNQLDGDQELKRVGQQVIKQKVALNKDGSLDLNKWNRHAIDLGKLIKTQPGAIYEVAIGFQKSYTLYDCDEGTNIKDQDMLALDDSWITGAPEAENSFWDYYYYDYDEEDNPCSASYYRPNRIVKRNILASDMGLIAKRGSGGAFFVATDLKTTRPMADVKLEIFDFQQQLITTATTNDEGMVEAKLERVPFLMVAKKGQQRGYLRLDDGTALSLSRFDTEGKKYFKGVKGFLYGERGVWRPGDPMYLTFVLEDKDKNLPANHPVNFELKDSRGAVVQRSVATQGTNGFYHFTAQTDQDAPTGNYRATVKVGGATFTRNLKVETIIPNRLKIEIDFPGKYLSSQTSGLTGELRSRWLHGAIAKNLKADVKVGLTSVPTRFATFTDYNFDDPIRTFNSGDITLFDGKLDETGVAKIQAKIKAAKAAPGMLSANFKVKVFEPGGAFSVDRFSKPYSPYPTYAGVKTPKGDAARGMLLTDTDHQIDIVTLDADGKKVSSEVEVKLYKLRWKWWWDKSAESFTNYRGKINAQELSSAKVSTENGIGKWTLNIKYPSWGRYLIRVTDKAGHATGKIVYVDWPGWAGRAADDERGGAQMLNFSADKPQYKVGEQVQLSIPTGQAGRALITVESGTRVLQSYWVNAEKGTTRFTLPATKEMAPNAYVSVSLLQPHSQTVNDLPMRLYGVIPVKVENPSTRLQPVISMPNELSPQSSVGIKVSEKGGKAMTYTLAVVDEGLLDLTRFKTPSPWNHFYQRIGLDVKTWDIYDYVLGAYGGQVNSLLSVGGGAGEEGPGGKKPDRFRPVVKYLGPFELKAGEQKNHVVEIGNYIGSVRTMVVAGDPRVGAYGRTEKATPVKKPLMVMGTLPRVLGPGETVGLPITVFALEDNIKVVNIKVETGKRILVNGKASQTMRFYEQGEKMTVFDLGVLSSLGTDHIKITASSGGQTAVYETDIEIRSANPRISDVMNQSITKGSSWNPDIKPVGMRGTNHGVLEVSTIPPLNLGKRLQYLIRYPYGCVEQTTSSVFPQLYLTQLMTLPASKKEKIDKNIRAGIKRLRKFQLPSGAMAYWPGNPRANEWGTNYAGNFLIEAKAAGFDVPSDMLSNWQKYVRGQARAYSSGDDRDQLTQAFRLYILALSGDAERGAMNRLQQQKGLKDMAKWYLAAAYQLSGQEEMARKLTRGLDLIPENYRSLSGTYGSTYRDMAIMLRTLSLMDQRDKAGTLVQKISDRLAEDRWMNTHATAYCLVAMAQYAGISADSKMKFSYSLDGKNWEDVTSRKPVWQIETDQVKTGKWAIKSKSGSMLFAQVVLDGIPMAGEETASAKDLKIEVKYLTLDGNSLDPTTLEQGTDFVAEVKVTNPRQRNLEEMSLDQIFPSGWEIHNTRLDGTSAGGDTPEFRDFRDDRVYTFYDLKPGKTQTYRVMLNASYLGKYYLSAVNTSAMYDETIYARTQGQWVKVVEPGQGG
ncbi:MAG: MG2 domain-containing protein [Bacteroidota bacterium]